MGPPSSSCPPSLLRLPVGGVSKGLGGRAEAPGWPETVKQGGNDPGKAAPLSQRCYGLSANCGQRLCEGPGARRAGDTPGAQGAPRTQPPRTRGPGPRVHMLPPGPGGDTGAVPQKGRDAKLAWERGAGFPTGFCPRPCINDSPAADGIPSKRRNASHVFK